MLHISPRGPSVLPEILDRAGPLKVQHARDGDRLVRGHVYVAPPDRHLVVVGDAMYVSDGPKENGCRPAIDVLFRSVAHSYRDRCVAVVLSGMLDDGTAGSIDVKRSGGIVVVQDPEGAMFPAMPSSAIAHAAPDHVQSLEEIAPLLAELVEKSSTEGRRGSEVSIEQSGRETPSEFTCPDCGGTLFEGDDNGRPLHFRCRVGHAYSPESLLVGKEAALEAALWAAVVALEERGDLTRRLYRRMSGLGTSAGDRYLRQASEIEEQAVLIRDLLAAIKGRTDSQESP